MQKCFIQLKKEREGLFLRNKAEISYAYACIHVLQLENLNVGWFLKN